MGFLQRGPRIDPELLHESSAHGVEDHERLCLVADTSQQGDEAGLHRFVHGGHRCGEVKSRQHAVRLTDRQCRFSSLDAGLKVLVIEACEDRRGCGAVGPSVPCGSLPQTKRFDKVIEGWDAVSLCRSYTPSSLRSCLGSDYPGE